MSHTVFKTKNGEKLNTSSEEKEGKLQRILNKNNETDNKKEECLEKTLHWKLWEKTFFFLKTKHHYTPSFLLVYFLGLTELMDII